VPIRMTLQSTASASPRINAGGFTVTALLIA
jgi:hypothetical protein